MYYARNTKNHWNCLKLFEEKENRTFIIFDTETTGLDDTKDRIVEFAAMKFQIQDKQPVLIGKMDLYIRPPFEMEEKVMEIHHITNDFLKDYPDETDQFPAIQAFLGEKPILIGYNTPFDIGMLNALYRRQNNSLTPEVMLDVREMGYDLFQDKEYKNHELGYLVRTLNLDSGIVFHNALADTEATYRLLYYCYQEYKKIPFRRNLERVYINYMYYWKGYRKEQAGIYLSTNLGKMYFSTYKKRWCSSEIDLSKVDINKMENDICLRTGLSFRDFGKLTENKFKQLKADRKEKGIYL